MSLHDKQLLDFGLGVRSAGSKCSSGLCRLNSLVIGYAWRWPPAAERDEFSWPVLMAIRGETSRNQDMQELPICSVQGKACPVAWVTGDGLATFLQLVFTA